MRSSSEQLKRWAPFALALGLGGLLVSGSIYAITRKVDPYVQGSLAVGLLGLALAGLFNPGAVQAWLGGRQARYGSNVMVMTLALLGILVIVNYVIYKGQLPFQIPTHWDLSQDQLNTLAPETVEAIRQLPEPVTAIGFYTSRNPSQTTTGDLLERYRVEAQGNFTYEFYDPVARPDKARQYSVTRDGTLILVMGQQKEELSFATESEITGALIRFSHPATRAIYFLTGHGERDITETGDNGLSKMVDLLKKQNYEVKTLSLQVSATVPSDARAVVIAGPLVPVSEDEAAVLGNYLHYNQNTALVVMLDTPIQTQADLAQPLSEPLVDYLSKTWGISLRNDIIADSTGGDPRTLFMTLNDGYENSPITSKLLKISTFFPGSRSVVVNGTAETFPDITYTPLIKTSQAAWGEVDLQGILEGREPKQGEGDTAGPLWLAVTAQNTADKSRLVVFGDSDFAINANADVGAANYLLFVNSVNWATAEESLINLTPKTPTSRTLVLRDPVTFNLIFFFTVIVMPLGVLVLGGVVWFLRRRHV